MVFARFAFVLASAAISSLDAAAHVHPVVHRTLQASGSADVMIIFKESPILKLEAAKFSERPFSSRVERIESLVSELETRATAIQQQVLDLHSAMRLESTEETPEVKSFWIKNSMFVERATPEFIASVAQLSEVAQIREPKMFPVPKVIIEKPEDELSADARVIPFPSAPTWGLDKVGAPLVWANGINGAGITVGTIDTGVRYTHEALRDSFVGLENNGWYDPEHHSETPYDVHGHGSHVTGTMCGSNGIGVAPGAKWLACKGCREIGCTEQDLLECAEYVTCPTDTDGENMDCSKAPHVINNSWGGGQGDLFFMDAIKAWREAGIIPVFALGNEGPECASASSPGDYPNVIGVGALNKTGNSLAWFSSRGPAVTRVQKPDITAPGHIIKSAYNISDESYAGMSGTSMASPHVSGIIALMLSAEPTLIGEYDLVKTALIGTADSADLMRENTCGGIRHGIVPNYNYGFGLASAANAIFGKGAFTPEPEPTTTKTPTPAPTTETPPPAPTTETPPPVPTTETPTPAPTPAPPTTSVCNFFKKKVLCNLMIVCTWSKDEDKCIRAWK